MATLTIISNATTKEDIKKSVSVAPLDRVAGCLPVFTVNAINERLTESDRAYYAEYRYNDASDVYMVGFEYKGEVYYGCTNSLLFGLIPHTNSKKNGGQTCLRFVPTSKIKQALIEKKAVFRICSRSELNLVVTAYDLNKGESFEKLICMNYGIEYHKNNIPYYVRGDVIIDCLHYNLKFEKGNITKRK